MEGILNLKSVQKIFNKAPQKKKEENEIQKSALYSEHLKEGIKPIMASFVESWDTFALEKTALFIDKVFSGFNLDYEDDTDKEITSLFKVIDGITHGVSFSPIDTRDKFSTDFFNCTGIVAVGKSIDTNQEISFLVHQDPRYFLFGKKEKKKFKKILKKRLSLLKKQCENNSIDVVIVGGRTYDPKKDKEDNIKYQKSIKLLDEIITDSYGFHPVVIAPKMPYVKPIVTGNDDTSIFFDTQQRRLVIVEEGINSKNEAPFDASTLNEQEKRWFKKNNI